MTATTQYSGPIRGAKGGETNPQPPVEAPDSLRSIAKAKILLALGEGEFFGDLDGKRIFVDGTPLEDDAGNQNFEGVKWDFRPGSQYQTHIPGIPSVENEIGVGVELKSGESWVKAITNSQLSAVRLRFRWPALQRQKDNGDVVGYSIHYRVEVATDGGSYQTALSTAVNGKSVQPYERSHRIELPEGSSWMIRVTRITPNQNSNRVADTMQLMAITDVIDRKFTYPNTALLYLEFDASQFQNIPQIACEPKMRIVRVPSNYNPETRAYDGIWDGGFKLAWTDNPVWVYYDIAIEPRFGTGKHLPAAMVDKWELYRIAQYCDELVSDGKGGVEPRFTCNIYIAQAAEAWQVLRDLAAIFRGMSYWAGGQMVTVCDMPSAVDYVFTNANVKDGVFSYSGTSSKVKYTRALVSYDDPENGYESDVTSIADQKLARRFGDNVIELAALGCSSESEAQRRGKWAIHTNNNDRTVTFVTGLEGEVPRPGMIIGVGDELIGGKRFGGRVSAVVNEGQLVIDAPSDIAPGYLLTVNLPSGKAETRTVYSYADKLVTLTAGFSEQPEPHAQWAVESPELVMQQFRVLARRKPDPDKLEYQITAVEHNPGKFPAIDNGAKLEARPISLLPQKIQNAPASVSISQAIHVEQGQSITTMTISWEPAAGAVAYEVEWQRDNGEWVLVPRTGSTAVDIKGVYTGDYMARVRAFNPGGIGSNKATSSLTAIEGKTTAPDTPQGLAASSVPFGINLSWSFPPDTEDTLHTELQVATTSNGSDAQKLTDIAYPGANYGISGIGFGVGYYFRARLVDKAGNLGPWTGWVSGSASANQSDYDNYFGGRFESYTWFAWADDDAGNGFTTNEFEGKGKLWMGVAADQSFELPSANWQDYVWTQVQTPIGELFTPSEQAQLDNLMAGKLPAGDKDMLALQDALNDPNFNNNLLTAQQLLNQGINAAGLGGATNADLAQKITEAGRGGDNLIVDAAFNNLTANGIPLGFALFGGQLPSATFHQWPPSEFWALNHQGQTGVIKQGAPEGANSNLYVDIATRKVTITDGQRICFSVYTGSHRTNAAAFIYFFDEAGNVVGNTPLDNNHNGPSGGWHISGYKRLISIGTAPANAVAASGIIRKYNTDQLEADSYLFYVWPQLCYLAPGQTQVPEWTPGSLMVLPGDIGAETTEGAQAKADNAKAQAEAAAALDALNKANNAKNLAVIESAAAMDVRIPELDAQRLKTMGGDHGLPYYWKLRIYGDPNTFYPVVFMYGEQNLSRQIKIWRAFWEHGPDAWHPTHKGALNLHWQGNFGGWGGASYNHKLIDYNDQYTTLFADAYPVAYNIGYVFFLRGGGPDGADYNFASDQNIGPAVYYNQELIYDSENDIYDVPAPAPIYTKNVEHIAALFVGYSHFGHLLAATGQFDQLKSRLANFGGLTAETIAALAIATNHLQAGVVTSDKLTADTAMIDKLVASQGLFDALQARFAVFGGLAASSIAAKAITTDKLHVLSKSLINNVSMTGTNDGWPGAAVVDHTHDGRPIKALELATTGDAAYYSEWFDVDPNKVYEVNMTICHYSGNPSTSHYFGLWADADMNVEIIDPTNRVVMPPDWMASNPYFWFGNLPLGSNHQMRAYILGANVDPSTLPDSMNVYYAFRLRANNTRVQLRVLNFYNAGNLATVRYLNMSAVELGSGQISANQLLANSALFNQLKAKIAAFGGLTATEILADTALINKIVGDSALFNELQARLAVFGGLTANSIAAGAILGNHIKAGEKISSPIIEGGEVRLIGTSSMKIESETPFGPDNLIYWRGPKLLVNGQPDWANIKKSNATRYTDSAGEEYFGGSLAAGKLKSGASNPLLGSHAINSYPVELGPFSTNGNAKNVVVSWALNAHLYSSSNPGALANPTMQWQLERKIGDGPWQAVSSGTFTGTYFTQYEAGTYYVNETVSASATYTDTNTSTQPFSYRLKVISYSRNLAAANTNSQTITVISTEQ